MCFDSVTIIILSNKCFCLLSQTELPRKKKSNRINQWDQFGSMSSWFENFNINRTLHQCPIQVSKPDRRSFKKNTKNKKTKKTKFNFSRISHEACLAVRTRLQRTWFFIKSPGQEKKQTSSRGHRFSHAF